MVRVASETGRLRSVIVQPPGVALERMLPAHIHPGSADYLLFDDLVHVDLAQREHDQLRAVLSSVAEVHFKQDLLATVLEGAVCRGEVIEQVARLHRLHDLQTHSLEQLDSRELAQALIVGTLDGTLDGADLFPPVPNLIFSRDPAAVFGDLVVVGNASKRVRRREAVLTWAVVRHHPLFNGARIAESSLRVQRIGQSTPLTIEGGDCLVVSPTLAIIGASERTTWSMILHLGRELLEGGFSRVLVVEMPKQRSSMHLDTVFTLVDKDRCVVYGPLLEVGGDEEVQVLRLRAEGGHVAVDELPGNLLDALAVEGHPLQPIFCGGRHPVYERREQWTDGANYVALGPGVVVGYGRNAHTAREMSRAGFRVMHPSAFLAEFKRDFRSDPDELFSGGRRYAIHLEGSELSRGRGGPRCLTMPIHRDEQP